MITETSPIGIFDSGLGGISVLNECLKHLPNEHYIYYGDSKNAPYGIKDKEAIIQRCIEICDFFITKNVKAIVVACNTATSAAVQTLRERYPIPIIGMEPALKVAAHNKQNQTIIVMATHLTLKEEKFANLMKCYESDHHIIKLPCPEFVTAIESDFKDHQAVVNHQLDQYASHIKTKQIDSIVLGCTHFVFLKQEIQNYFQKPIQVIDGNEGTAKHLAHILEEKQLLSKQPLKIDIYNSDNSKIELSKRLITPDL
ncbi:glutamate racemase [Breznakia sp. OttesenSCG-928-G09]|nr:glutamate racemase [Breznakia sp. OttesenSCG-928-G09]